MSRQIAECGTRPAYNRHLRHGEDPCEACQEANNARARTNPKARHIGRSYQRALRRLANLHREEFDALYAEEKASPL